MPDRNHIVAVDRSDSTFFSTNKEYWPTVLKHLNTINDKNARYVFWDHRDDPSINGLEQAQATIETYILNGCPECKEKGKNIRHGGTDPSTFIQYLKPGDDGNDLTLFTDGQIHQNLVTKCEEHLKNIKINRLTVFYIGPKNNMNRSVPARFTSEECTPKQGMHFLEYINGEKTEESDFKPVSTKIDHYWNQPVLFLTEVPKFINQIRLQNLGRINLSYRNQLLDLQKNLLSKLAEKIRALIENEIVNLSTILNSSAENKEHQSIQESKDAILARAKSQLEVILAIIGTGTGNGNGNEKTREIRELNKQINEIKAYFEKIIILLQEKGSFEFDQKISNRITRAPEVKNIAIEDIKHDIPIPADAGECAITLEPGLLIFLVKGFFQSVNDGPIEERYPPLFRDISKNLQDELISCPFNIFKHPELITKLLNFFSTMVPTLETTLKLSDRENSTDSLLECPYTRERIEAVISLVDEESHRRANEYALAYMLFGKKSVAVTTNELWLCVIYFAIKNSDRFKKEDNYADLIRIFRKYLINLLKNNNTYMTLSGLSDHGPLLKVPVATAMWYCVVSALFPSVPNRLRAIITREYLEILDLLDYPYDREWTWHQLAIYEANGRMLKQAKEDHKKLNDWVRSLHQNSSTISDGTLIMLDGSPKHDPKSLRISPQNIGKPIEDWLNAEQYDEKSDDYLLTVSVGEILTLAKQVSPSKKEEAIDIPNNFPASELPATTINYNAKENETKYKTELCPLTLRPFSVDPLSKKEWQVAAEERFGPLSGQISAYSYFIRYVTEEGKIPSKEEFIKWLAEKQSQREIDRKDTLPMHIVTTTHNVFDSFTQAISGIFISPGYANSIKHLLELKSGQNVNEDESVQFLFDKEKLIFDNKKDYKLTDFSVQLFIKVTSTSRDKTNRSTLESVYHNTNSSLLVTDDVSKNTSHRRHSPNFYRLDSSNEHDCKGSQSSVLLRRASM